MPGYDRAVPPGQKPCAHRSASLRAIQPWAKPRYVFGASIFSAASADQGRRRRDEENRASCPDRRRARCRPRFVVLSADARTARTKTNRASCPDRRRPRRRPRFVGPISRPKTKTKIARLALIVVVLVVALDLLVLSADRGRRREKKKIARLGLIMVVRFSGRTSEAPGKQSTEKTMGKDVLWQVDAGSPGSGGASPFRQPRTIGILVK